MTHLSHSFLIIEGAWHKGKEAYSTGKTLIEVIDELHKVLFRVLRVVQQAEQRVFHVLQQKKEGRLGKCATHESNPTHKQ